MYMVYRYIDILVVKLGDSTVDTVALLLTHESYL